MVCFGSARIENYLEILGTRDFLGILGLDSDYSFLFYEMIARGDVGIGTYRHVVCQYKEIQYLESSPEFIWHLTTLAAEVHLAPGNYSWRSSFDT